MFEFSSCRLNNNNNSVLYLVGRSVRRPP